MEEDTYAGSGRRRYPRRREFGSISSFQLGSWGLVGSRGRRRWWLGRFLREPRGGSSPAFRLLGERVSKRALLDPRFDVEGGREQGILTQRPGRHSKDGLADDRW